MILWTTKWAHPTALVIPAALNPFCIISGCLKRNSYTSKIYCTCSGLSLERANNTLTVSGFIPLISCFVTSSANQALYLVVINDLTGLLTVMLRDLNLLEELGGMITTWQNSYTNSYKNPTLLCYHLSTMLLVWDKSKCPWDHLNMETLFA